MSTWIEIEKEYFDKNIREARDYEWIEIRAAHLAEHVHCMICGVTIDTKSPMTTCAHKSKAGYVCAYCFDHFLK